MKRAVSISLGSSRRNHASETVLCGEPIRFERIGADGDRHAMRRMFLELMGRWMRSASAAPILGWRSTQSTIRSTRCIIS
ncbi:MAG: hypothetical protein R2873_34160 [Caldilineaceae bacterium]